MNSSRRFLSSKDKCSTIKKDSGMDYIYPANEVCSRGPIAYTEHCFWAETRTLTLRRILTLGLLRYITSSNVTAGQLGMLSWTELGLKPMGIHWYTDKTCMCGLLGNFTPPPMIVFAAEIWQPFFFIYNISCFSFKKWLISIPRVMWKQ